MYAKRLSFLVITYGGNNNGYLKYFVTVLPKDLKTLDSEELQQETEEIDSEFGILAAKIYRSLINRNIFKDSLVACLMGFKCRSKIFKGPNRSLFRNEQKKFEDPTTTIGTVWSIVGDYFSFFDYEVLEVIINTLGSEEDKEDFKDYKRDFEEYAKRRSRITKISSEGSCLDREKVLFKLDDLYDGCEFRCLKRLQKRLSNILKLNEGVLKLLAIEDGCILLMFEIPDFISESIFPLSTEQESALQELGVTRLDCVDHHFTEKVRVTHRMHVRTESWIEGAQSVLGREFVAYSVAIGKLGNRSFRNLVFSSSQSQF